MGGIHRLKRSMGSMKMAVADTHVTINGCQVLLGHPNPKVATEFAEKFKEFLSIQLARARVPNMSDFYDAHFQICERLKAGEELASIVGEEAV